MAGPALIHLNASNRAGRDNRVDNKEREVAMSHVPHELAEEFPDDHELLHALKVSNAHFSHLADTYHDVNRQIHRIETQIEPTSDEVLNTLKSERLHLKDEIAAIIAAERRAVA